MVSENWLGICLDKRYGELFEALKVKYEVLSFQGSEQEIAQKVGNYAKSAGKKPFVVDFAHYLMAYCVPDDATAIYFDNHADDGIDYKPQQNFTSGTFQLFAPGKQHLVLGATAKQYGRRAKVFPPERIRDVLSEPLTARLFLSLDLDVLDPKFYDVSIWSQSRLSSEDISSVLAELIRGREVTGLNIASYVVDNKNTIPIVRKILSPLTDFK
jgi:hypothetical protein